MGNGYYAFTKENALQYANELKLSDVVYNRCHEIGDGNLNLVFHVYNNETKQGVIVKQALPYAKLVGESWPLTIKRATIESDALRVFGKLLPKYVPTLYHHDETLGLTVMEDLSRFAIARKGLIQGESYEQLSNHIGEFIAHTLFFTSDYGSSPAEKKELEHTFFNPELCNITEDLVFTDPFFNSETNEYEAELQGEVESLWENDTLRLEVAKLKAIFLSKRDALIHGDLHTGSIFASREETKVIDPEFAIVGPFGFDIGQFIANLYLQALSRENDSLFAREVEKVWDVFTVTFTKLWKENVVGLFAQEAFLQNLLGEIQRDAIGFAGCEMIRRTIGLAHVEDLDGIDNVERKLTAKRHALEIGQVFILKRNELTAKDTVALFNERVYEGVKG